MDMLPPRRFAVVAGVVTLATIAPLLIPSPAALLSLRGALALLTLLLIMVSLYGLQELPLQRHALQRAGLVFLVIAGITELSFAWQGLEIAPALFAMATLGARVPSRWVARLAVPLVAYLLWLFNRGITAEPLTVLTNALGLFGLLFLGFNLNRRRSLSLTLQEANRELALRAEQEGELARLRERERLARDLHDTLGHALSTLTVQLEAAKRLSLRAPGRVPGQIEEAQALTRQALQDLRGALDDLRTSGAPLPDWIADRAAQLAARSGWTLHLDLQPVSLPPQTVEDVRRIAAEALENVARHARATQVSVTLHEANGQLRLSVRDDGRGFGPHFGSHTLPDEHADGHYGVRGMRERATLLGGTLGLASRAGFTELILLVPLRVSQPSPERPAPKGHLLDSPADCRRPALDAQRPADRAGNRGRLPRDR